VRDWASWQREGALAFAGLKRVLDVLSPSDDEPLRPGSLVKISVDDPKRYPTLAMPYGQDVPVIHASAGMRRIIALAYLLVRAWHEHIAAAELLGDTPTSEDRKAPRGGGSPAWPSICARKAAPLRSKSCWNGPLKCSATNISISIRPENSIKDSARCSVIPIRSGLAGVSLENNEAGSTQMPLGPLRDPGRRKRVGVDDAGEARPRASRLRCQRPKAWSALPRRSANHHGREVFGVEPGVR